MKSWRSLSSWLLALLLSSAIFGVCYWLSAQAWVALNRRPADELAWLSREFHLTEAELVRVRSLHNGYQPKCQAMCTRIEAKNRELIKVLQSATNISGAVEQKLTETALLRAECQAEMLRHFQEVARTLPGPQGARYLSEMHRLTLGLSTPREPMIRRSAAHEH